MGTHDPAGAAPVFASLRSGIGALPQALAASLTVRTNVTVRAIERTATGLRLIAGAVPQSEVIEADAVVVALPAREGCPVAGARHQRAGGAELGEVETASVAMTTFAFRDVVVELPVGSGRPGRLARGSRGEGRDRELAEVAHGNRAADRAARKRGTRGGEQRVLQREDTELAQLVRRDLRSILGLTAEPIDTIVTRWGGGLPQYAVGHVDRDRSGIRAGCGR